jgi:hypothetical protein
MSRTIGVDMHNHVYPAGTEPHPQRGQPPRQEEQQQAPGLSIAEELKRSGLTAVCASFVLDFAPSDKPGYARDVFLHWLTAIDAQLETGHMHRAMTLKDLRAAHDHGQPTIVQTVGSDTDLLSSRVGQGTNRAWPGLTGGFFHAVVGEMLLQGFTPDHIGKVGGGNFCRVFGKVTAGHA